jgi:hypothetical protein
VLADVISVGIDGPTVEIVGVDDLKTSVDETLIEAAGPRVQ